MTHTNTHSPREGARRRAWRRRHAGTRSEAARASPRAVRPRESRLASSVISTVWFFLHGMLCGERKRRSEPYSLFPASSSFEERGFRLRHEMSVARADAAREEKEKAAIVLHRDCMPDLASRIFRKSSRKFREFPSVGSKRFDGVKTSCVSARR